ncbi:MAG TPA: CBS domain-containing protein [Chloroflexi bacterium]|nr:CBS domain-containing protein [Chloroflexota bacterium]HAL28961.1 CBS domain-containing protein [Chloroflexota bacterium]
MKVEELMTRDPATLRPDSTCSEAAVLMKREDCGSLPVVKDGRLVGIVTDRDIVVRGVAGGKDPTHLAVSEVMTSGPITIAPGMNAEEASKLMSEKQVRRLPVVDGGRLVGILAIGQLARHESANVAGETLKEVSQPAAKR